jgi:hypothetical protein
VSFDHIVRELRADDSRLTRLLKSLDDIKLFLSHDLNPQAIVAIDDIIDRARTDATELQDGLGSTLSSLQGVLTAMSFPAANGQSPSGSFAAPADRGAGTANERE